MAAIIQFPYTARPSRIHDVAIWEFIEAAGAYFGWRQLDVLTAQLVTLDQIAANYQTVIESFAASPLRAEIEGEITRARDHISRTRESVRQAYDEATSRICPPDRGEAAGP